jgi:hypothetical protein
MLVGQVLKHAVENDQLEKLAESLQFRKPSQTPRQALASLTASSSSLDRLSKTVLY